MYLWNNRQKDDKIAQQQHIFYQYIVCTRHLYQTYIINIRTTHAYIDSINKKPLQKLYKKYKNSCNSSRAKQNL